MRRWRAGFLSTVPAAKSYLSQDLWPGGIAVELETRVKVSSRLHFLILEREGASLSSLKILLLDKHFLDIITSRGFPHSKSANASAHRQLCVEGSPLQIKSQNISSSPSCSRHLQKVRRGVRLGAVGRVHIAC